MVRERLDAEAVDVFTGGDNVRLFHDSLASALAHLTLRPAPIDPDGEPLSIVAGYVETLIPNALADFENGTHLIAMNNAMFVAIHEFAMFCFTQRDFFNDVGDPDMEVSPSPLHDSVPGLWLSLRLFVIVVRVVCSARLHLFDLGGDDGEFIKDVTQMLADQCEARGFGIGFGIRFV